MQTGKKRSPFSLESGSFMRNKYFSFSELTGIERWRNSGESGLSDSSDHGAIRDGRTVSCRQNDIFDGKNVVYALPLLVTWLVMHSPFGPGNPYRSQSEILDPGHDAGETVIRKDHCSDKPRCAASVPLLPTDIKKGPDPSRHNSCRSTRIGSSHEYVLPIP